MSGERLAGGGTRKVALGGQGGSRSLGAPLPPPCASWPDGAGSTLFAWQAGQGTVGAKRGSWRGLTGHERSGEPSEGFSWVSVVFFVFIFRIVFGDQSNGWRKYGLRGKAEAGSQLGGCGHLLVTDGNCELEQRRRGDGREGRP